MFAINHCIQGVKMSKHRTLFLDSDSIIGGESAAIHAYAMYQYGQSDIITSWKLPEGNIAGHIVLSDRLHLLEEAERRGAITVCFNAARIDDFSAMVSEFKTATDMAHGQVPIPAISGTQQCIAGLKNITPTSSLR
jgi:hypothetical protein